MSHTPGNADPAKVIAGYCAAAALWLGLALAPALADVAAVEPLPGKASWLRSQPLTPLWITSKTARCWRFNTWVARTPEEFSRGLMFVRKLDDDGGMLFALSEEREISMWMRNTYVPLDILFADAAGTIISIYENAVPLTLDHMSSGQPAFAVLELSAGSVASRGISPGDRIRHAHFGNGGCQDKKFENKDQK